MTPMIWPVAAFCFLAISLHFISTVIALARCKTRLIPLPAPANAEAVTLIRPVCGVDHGIRETLRSSFELDYPRYEILFCVASSHDPVVPIVETLIAAHPNIQARLLVGNERISVNPKLNNCFKGWRAATTPWVILSDANVLMPHDYVQRLMSAWLPDTGLVCSPPIGSNPRGFWAEVECAFLNTHQARWQYSADTIGLGFAQGKTMLWRRDILEREGGMRALASEVAEDAASTKLIRNTGRRVRLVDGPFVQPLGLRSARDVWKRQARWAQLRRASFPLYFLPEILSDSLVPLLASAAVALANGVSVVGTVSALAAFWYGSEALLAYGCGWPVSWRTPFAAITRDLIMPLVYIAGWRDTGFEWRGNQMRVDDAEPAPASPGSDR